MPHEIGGTLSRSTLPFTMLRAFIQPMQSASATHAPVIEAVRGPPSAGSTSQSPVIWRSPSASRSTVARKERPIRRWIWRVRPPCLPVAASRRVRSSVARGSMPYSAVTQPRPWPLSHGGSRSSSVAVTSTWVSPNLTMQEPSAYLTTPRSSDTARSSCGARRLGRMGNPPRIQQKVAGGCGRRGKGERQGPWPSNARVYLAPEIDKLGSVEGVACGPPRSDWPDRAECRARPAQRAFAGYISSNRRELSSDRRTRRFAQHFAPDRGAAVAGLGAERDVGSGAARPDLCAAYVGGTAADRIGFAVFRRCLDAGRRSHRTGTAVDPEPACVRRQGATSRGPPSRSLDAAVRPDTGRRGGADRKIQFAAEAYRIRAAGAGTGAGGAGG